MTPASKICFLSLSHRADDTRVLHKEARSLADAGFDVIHIAPSDRTGEWTEAGVRIIPYPRSGGVRGRLRRFVTLLRAAHAAGADMYHCNELESWLVGGLIKLARPSRKIIFDVHEHFPSRFGEPHISPWVALVGRPSLWIMIRALTPWTDHIIFAKQGVAADYPCKPGRSSFIFNYAPLWLLEQEPSPLPAHLEDELERHPYAVHVGGFSRARGWPQLLEAMSLAHHKDLRVLCLGEVTEGEDVFLARACELGVAERVRIEERLDYATMFACLQKARMGLMLYQPGIVNHVYAFPMKLYDYMSAALPSIGPAFAVEVKPVFDEVACGILIDTSSAQELADAMDSLLDHPEDARAMGDRARAAIVDKYNWDAQAEKLVAIYMELGAHRPAQD